MPLESYKAEIISAHRHTGGLKMQPCLAVEARWFAAIQEDTSRLIERREASDVMQKTHPSHWVRPFGQGTQHNLFNKSGKTSDYADFGAQAGPSAFAAPECEALGRLFRCFEERLVSFRLNGLMPGSGLGAHEEAILKQDQIRLRFHLPIFTNEQASLLLDDEKFWFRPGIIYFFNNGSVHAAENLGSTPRYHLVWDMWLDDWIYDKLLDLNSSSTPGDGLRKLSEREAAELSRGEPCPIQQYVIGTPSGDLYLAEKQVAPDGNVTLKKQQLNGSGDIVPGDGSVQLGSGWYPLEHFKSETFRWVNNNAEFQVWSPVDGTRKLQIEAEPGPGSEGALEVRVLDSFGCDIHSLKLEQRQKITVPLPVHSNQVNGFQLAVNGGGRTVPGDPRILNFRVFQIDAV
jgi:hypothetical protein